LGPDLLRGNEEQQRQEAAVQRIPVPSPAVPMGRVPPPIDQILEILEYEFPVTSINRPIQIDLIEASQNTVESTVTLIVFPKSFCRTSDIEPVRDAA
jgi:hypothetical protein